MENVRKLRLLALYKILNEKSDEGHPISTVELIAALKNGYGISAHRTTVSTDIAVLKSAGSDIEVIESTQNKYYMASRKFEIPELKMLIDAVRSSKFITEQKSVKLVDKLCSLASCHQAEELKCDFYLEDYDKPKNEKIYYIIDCVNRAIKEKTKISFRYYRYNVSDDMLLRQDGEPYHLSPYALVWNGDFYYTVGFSDKHERITTFRIDRIADVPAVLKSEYIEPPKEFDFKKFMKTAFRMYGGEIKRVTLTFDNTVVGSIVDKFGSEIKLKKIDQDTFAVTEEVAVSPVFFRWVFGFGGKIKIKSPESVKKEYAETVENAYKEILKENEK